MSAAVFAGVAHLTSPSVVAGERNATSGPTPPMAISGSELFRREADAVFDPMIVKRLTATEEPDTHGASTASTAAYQR